MYNAHKVEPKTEPEYQIEDVIIAKLSLNPNVPPEAGCYRKMADRANINGGVPIATHEEGDDDRRPRRVGTATEIRAVEVGPDIVIVANLRVDQLTFERIANRRLSGVIVAVECVTGADTGAPTFTLINIELRECVSHLPPLVIDSPR